MKKIVGFAALMLFLMAGCFTAFAQKERPEYQIYYVDFWVDEANGEAVVEWDPTEAGTSYKVQLMKAKTNKGRETAVMEKKLGHSTTRLVVTDVIALNGTGYYRAVITPVKDTLSFAVSDTMHVDSYLLERIRHSTGSQNYGWVLNGDGTWSYIRPNGTQAMNCWELVDGKWYRFNGQGIMLTGWHWVMDRDGVYRCYYMHKNGDCQMGGVTPDGYTVDANGAWTVNGVVQVK